MIFFDIETLGIESTSILLSIGAISVDPTAVKTAEDLLSNRILIKFDAARQRKLGRTADLDTMAWWAKQNILPKKASLFPSSEDVSLSSGLSLYAKWFEIMTKEDRNPIVWTRGSMDSVVYESCCRQIGIPAVCRYNNYRDVRTAIEILYPKSKGGYIDVDANSLPGWNPNSYIKHNPVHDCVIDAAQLFYGQR